MVHYQTPIMVCLGMSLTALAACNDKNGETGSGGVVSPTEPVQSTPPEDGDGDGYTVDEDCDDGNAEIHPDADEICDGRDNDCDGDTDGNALDARTWYPDTDADSYGDSSQPSITACAQPSGYALQADDCDDQDSTVNPGAAEVCDGVDNNCDGISDEDDPALDTSTLSTWYLDVDMDGYGDSSQPSITACTQPSGYALQADDCDDQDSTVSPGAAEVCGDGADNNCNGTAEEFPACGDWVGQQQTTFEGSSTGTLCDILWQTSGTPSTSPCPSCDFSYDVSSTDGVDRLGACSWTSDPLRSVAYDSDYYGYEAMLYHTGDDWVFLAYASFDGSRLSYSYLDEYVGYYSGLGTLYYNLWSEVLLSP